MSPHRGNRGRIEPDQTREFDHPVRLGILGLFTKDPGRSLAAGDLLAALVAEDPDAFADYDIGQIFYHRTRLQKAQLIPAG